MGFRNSSSKNTISNNLIETTYMGISNHANWCTNHPIMYMNASRNWKNQREAESLVLKTNSDCINEKIENLFQNNKMTHFDTLDEHSRDDKFLNAIVTYVIQNIDNPELTVNSLVSVMSVSRTQLHRKLKKLSGLSTTQFIKKIRLKKAASLLQQNMDNISQIAYQTGFSDNSYFSKCFKKYYGVAPSMFVKKLNSGYTPLICIKM